ncbi:hypothetical protein [Sneathiella aquimaris]|uniref:hypothetical protein n=1 Tax=Sneathiella aquimaris TaxID=2599305 RepID=UPI00146AFADE|nr:hypothetical protein [Sneathiella aquimaris]
MTSNSDAFSHKVFLDKTAGVIFIRHGAVLNFDILMRVATEANETPGLLPGYGSFVDFRACERIDLTSDDVRKVNNFVQQKMAWRGVFPIAFVTASKLTHGISRMYGSFLNEGLPTVNIFTAPEPALEWLGLPRDYKLPF